ncbi:MAG TPA: regulatory iron-sulfur-containing complex subunit RicT [Candidatus Hydrogenedentes bacterium]|nr:regulatory iron-sulfur-containing complex subunit RicT [Candidatus Hydrogenedentota bacterium]HOL77691.1 regulatory iron-sulfur-containing complex subunit RicT [Candidatus Hydrogenedentota bacterium]HPO86814.1 regulatory iron-sulfur-containing complex subunit RicT [Candidatus Hydrogenedentota bacterium]
MPIAYIRLRKPTQVFPCSCEIEDLKRDDPCIVRSERGLEFGTCVVPPRPCDEDTEASAPLQFVRKATTNDISTLHQIQVEEKKAREVCLKRIEESRLPMKLVDAEYTFDRHRITFYFTADDRVDFRELVRQLAHELHVRIELRHIPVRDEARIVGGIGVCGLTLCCSTWLKEFQPISMKMAKRQNLSLNPAKISGQCGRLLCCLGYENDLYPSKKERERTEEPLPKWEEEVALADSAAYSDEDDVPILDEETVEPAKSIEFVAEDSNDTRLLSDTLESQETSHGLGREPCTKPETAVPSPETQQALTEKDIPLSQRPMSNNERKP